MKSVAALNVLFWGLLLWNTSVQAYPQADLKLVGESRLSVLWWDIYEAALYNPEGRYQGLQPPLLLKLSYLRDIDKDDLIDASRDELQRLQAENGLDDRAIEKGLSDLRTIWPDIQEGDSLSFYLQQGGSRFYFNDELIGQISNDRFAQAFIAIWLSDNSAYPQLSQQLRGEP